MKIRQLLGKLGIISLTFFTSCTALPKLTEIKDEFDEKSGNKPMIHAIYFPSWYRVVKTSERGKMQYEHYERGDYVRSCLHINLEGEDEARICSTNRKGNITSADNYTQSDFCRYKADGKLIKLNDDDCGPKVYTEKQKRFDSGKKEMLIPIIHQRWLKRRKN